MLWIALEPAFERNGPSKSRFGDFGVREIRAGSEGIQGSPLE